MPTNLTKMSFHGLLYYGAAGSTASTLLENVTEVTISMESNTEEITPRGDSTGPPVEDAAVTKIVPGLEFTMLLKSDDTSQAAMRTAAAAGTPVALRGLDYAAGKGPDFDYFLTVENGQPENGKQTLKYTAKVTSQGGRALTLANLYT